MTQAKTQQKTPSKGVVAAQKLQSLTQKALKIHLPSRTERITKSVYYAFRDMYANSAMGIVRSQGKELNFKKSNEIFEGIFGTIDGTQTTKGFTYIDLYLAAYSLFNKVPKDPQEGIQYLISVNEAALERMNNKHNTTQEEGEEKVEDLIQQATKELQGLDGNDDFDFDYNLPTLDEEEDEIEVQLV